MNLEDIEHRLLNEDNPARRLDAKVATALAVIAAVGFLEEIATSLEGIRVDLTAIRDRYNPER